MDGGKDVESRRWKLTRRPSGREREVSEEESGEGVRSSEREEAKGKLLDEHL